MAEDRDINDIRDQGSKDANRQSETSVPPRRRVMLKRAGKRIYLLIPVVSLVISAFAIRRAYQTSKVLEQVASDSKQISANLTTRYIGVFPDFLPEIVKTLEEANKSILIAVDFPGYGIYSDHEGYLRYREVVERKATKPGFDVRIVVLSEKERTKKAGLQFKGVTVDKLKDPSNPLFAGFLRWSKRKSDDVATMDDFVRAMLKEQRRALVDDFRNAECKEYASDIPMNLWIADDKEGIFSIPDLTGGPHETAFHTRDQRLIGQLRTIFNTYLSASHPVAP